jgi:hypothetical protein
LEEARRALLVQIAGPLVLVDPSGYDTVTLCVLDAGA